MNAHTKSCDEFGFGLGSQHEKFRSFGFFDFRNVLLRFLEMFSQNFSKWFSTCEKAVTKDCFTWRLEHSYITFLEPPIMRYLFYNARLAIEVWS